MQVRSDPVEQRLLASRAIANISSDESAVRERRSHDNPLGGWYGLRKGYRGRFAMYMRPLLEHLGLVELERSPRNNRVRVR